MTMKIIMITQQQQQQQQQQQEEGNKELNYFDSIYHLAEVSVYKLNPPSRPRTEPTLRRQLLVRNLLEMSARLIITQPKQEEELWLEACFNQLNDHDQVMDDDDHQQEDQEEQVQEKIVLMIPFCKNKQKTLFNCKL